MKAIVRDRYGPADVLRLADVDPPALGDDGVLVRVRAAAVNPFDWHVMRGKPYLVRLVEGPRRPRSPVLGMDLAGVVEAVGARVTTLQPGQEVYGARAGAFAELVLGGETVLAPKPAGLDFVQAAAVPVAAITAMQALRDKAGVRPGEQVLVNGASGGVGTFAVQIATALGAVVTGVCSTHNIDLVRSLGADRVVDYTRADFTRAGPRYDVIIDVTASRPLRETRRALAPDGRLVIVGARPGDWVGPLWPPVQAAVLSRFSRQSMQAFVAKITSADLTALSRLIEDGSLRPVIDRTYPLAEAGAAIRYVESGHARGKVVLTV